MAGKKKIGKKGGKKKDKKETEGDVGPEVTVLDKNYYMTQIKSLERNIERVTQRCEQLSEAENHARKEYRNLHQEKEDIVAFLRESLKSREDEIEELRNRLAGLIKARHTERGDFEDRLKRLNQELEKTKADLSDQILSLTRKLESLEEFRQQKEELDAEHSLLQETLQREREEHKEKISMLERFSIEESETLRREQEERLTHLKEELRKEARKEMHSTTKAAIVENEALNKSLSTIKSKVLRFRQENLELRNNISEQNIREAVLQDTLDQMTSSAERKASILMKIAQKAEDHSRVYKEYGVVLEEKEKTRRDLQQMQVQLDAATRMTCDFRENVSEKALALELLATKLQEERSERMKLTEALQSALQILQESIFGDDHAPEGDAKIGITNVTLTHLVDILSSTEQNVCFFNQDEQKENENEKDKLGNKKIGGEPLITYSAGDLGFVPKKSKGKQKPS